MNEKLRRLNLFILHEFARGEPDIDMLNALVRDTLTHLDIREELFVVLSEYLDRVGVKVDIDFSDIQSEVERDILKMGRKIGFVVLKRGEKPVLTTLRQTKANDPDLRALADSGLRTQTSRLDNAVRLRVLAAQRDLTLRAAEKVGEEIGADGYEVDYHSNPRPTHAIMGGRQYAKGEGRFVGGKYFPPFEEALKLLAEPNCLHFFWAIKLGISQPSYTDEQLNEFKANDARVRTIDGKEYTGYEATQEQRRLERLLRASHDRKYVYKAANDERLAEENERYRRLNLKYKDFSTKAGLQSRRIV